MTRRSAMHTNCGLIFGRACCCAVCGSAAGRPGPGLGPAGDVRRRPRPASSATRPRTRRSTSSGATASTTGPTSAATSATWPRRASRTPSSTRASGSPRSSRPRTAPAATSKEGEEFAHSHHSKGARILGSLDNTLAEVVEGNRGMVTPAFPEGRQRGGRQRLLAVPRQRGQGAARRQARSGHLAQHGHRPDQSRRLGRLLLGLPQPALLLRLAGPASRQLRQVPHGTRPSADGDLLRVQARHRLPRVPGQAEHGFVEVGRGRGLPPGPDLRHLPHERHAGPAATKDRPAMPGLPVTHDVGLRISWNNRPGDLRPPRGQRQEDGPARRERQLGDPPRQHEERLPQLPRAAVGRQFLHAVRQPDRAVPREVRQARAWSCTSWPSRC